MKKLIFLIPIWIILMVMLSSMYISHIYTIQLTFDSINEDVNYKLFYLYDDKESFNESDSIYCYSNKTDEFKKNIITVNFEEPKIITDIRLDFGNEINNFQLDNIELIGATNKLFNAESFESSIYRNIKINNINDNYINFDTTDIGSRIIFKDVNINTDNNIQINYAMLIILSSIVFSIIYIIFLLLGKYKYNEVLFSIIIIFILFYPSLNIDNEKISITENRTLESFPQIYINEKFNQNLINDFESWYNDHYGMRNLYLSFNNFITTLFQPNRIETSNVLHGKENWLFTKINESIMNYQGITYFDNEELNDIKNTLVERESWLNAQGIKYYLYIAPDKHRVYPEYYPDYINKISNDRKIDQLLDIMADTNVNIIYSDNLKDKNTTSDYLYYKLDAHWTSLGAFYGYLDIMDAICKDFDNVEPLNLDDMNIKYKSDVNGLNNQLGDVIYDDTQYPDLEYKYTSKFIEYPPRILLSKYLEYDKYTINELNVMVFRDSFTVNMTEFLSETFNTVDYIWAENINYYQDEILEYKPDIIIDESVERLSEGKFSNLPSLKEVE